MRGAIVCAGLVAVVACGEDRGPGAAPSASAVASSAVRPPASAPAAAGGAATSATPACSASASAPASGAPSAPTLAQLRADAAADPARVEGKPATLTARFVGRAARSFGSGEHPVHTFVVARFDLGADDPAPLDCELPEGRWLPPELAPGDPITVTGTWSFDRFHTGGIVAGGGALHLVGCAVARRAP